MSPVLLVCLGLPALLGLLVFLLILVRTGKQVKAVYAQRRAQRGSQNPPVPMLDQPFPCPTCISLLHVAVARGDFKEMPYVEHFLCHACGTRYLGPNQEIMVGKRLVAKRRLEDALNGRKLTAVESSKPAKK